MNDEINNSILKSSKEHKIILDYLLDFDKSIMTISLDDLKQEFQKKYRYFFLEVKKHFELEEKVFFAAIFCYPKVTQKMVRVVSQEIRKHGELFAGFLFFLDFLEGEYSDGDLDYYQDHFKKVSDDFKRHAKVEIQTIFPYISQNEEICELVRTFQNY